MANIKATQRLIDSVWTVEYKVLNETEVEIIKFGRNDKDGYVNERNLSQHKIIETDDRIAIKLAIRDKYKQFDNFVNESNCDRCYNIVNQKRIFNYD